MIEHKIPDFSFQTFYASREVSNCPLISEIIRVIKRFEKINLLNDNIDISISMKYGKRVLINAKNIDLFKINMTGLNVHSKKYDLYFLIFLKNLKWPNWAVGRWPQIVMILKSQIKF